MGLIQTPSEGFMCVTANTIKSLYVCSLNQALLRSPGKWGTDIIPHYSAEKITNLPKDTELGHKRQNLNSEFRHLSITQGSSSISRRDSDSSPSPMCMHVLVYICACDVHVYVSM